MSSDTKKARKKWKVNKSVLLDAWRLMCTAKEMTDIYEENFKLTSKYVHATSRGHEAVQIALGLQLKAQDYLSAYYRDDSILLSIGMKPYELMLQLMAKRDDPFSGGRTYYSHPSLRDDDKPKIPHQSSATGMQAIPTTGVAMGLEVPGEQGPGRRLRIRQAHCRLFTGRCFHYRGGSGRGLPDGHPASIPHFVSGTGQ